MHFSCMTLLYLFFSKKKYRILHIVLTISTQSATLHTKKGNTMNLNTLHHYLTTLSPSELRYRAGERYTGWENMPKVFVQDKEYSLLNITDTDSRRTTSCIFLHPRYPCSTARNLHQKKFSLQPCPRTYPSLYRNQLCLLGSVSSGNRRETCYSYEKPGSSDRHQLPSFYRGSWRR